MSATTDLPSSPPPASRASSEPRYEGTLLSFQLLLDARRTLFTVLVTVARLGGEVSYLLVRDTHVELMVLAPPQTVHRFASVLAEVIGVVTLTDRTAAAPPPSAPDARTR